MMKLKRSLARREKAEELKEKAEALRQSAKEVILKTIDKVNGDKERDEEDNES